MPLCTSKIPHTIPNALSTSVVALTHVCSGSHTCVQWLSHMCRSKGTAAISPLHSSHVATENRPDAHCQLVLAALAGGELCDITTPDGVSSPMYTHTHTRTHASTHTQARTHTHTHTHTQHRANIPQPFNKIARCMLASQPDHAQLTGSSGPQDPRPHHTATLHCAPLHHTLAHRLIRSHHTGRPHHTSTPYVHHTSTSYVHQGYIRPHHTGTLHCAPLHHTLAFHPATCTCH